MVKGKMGYQFWAVVFLFICFFTRPFFLAEVGNNAAFSAVLFAVIAIISFRSFKKYDKSIYSKYLRTVSLIFFCIFILSLVINPDSSDYVVKNLVTFLPITFFGGIVLSNEKLRYYFFKLMILINCLSIFCGICTSILYFIFNYSFQNLTLTSIGYDYHVDSYILFPGSFYYGNFGEYNLNPFPRFMGLFREPGISQLFYAIFALIAPRFGYKNFWFRTILLIGIVITFSTVGIISFFAVLIYIYLEKRGFKFTFKQAISSIVGLAIIFYAFAYTPLIGFSSKSTGEQRKSFEDRNMGMEYMLKEVPNHPFGTGLSYGKSTGTVPTTNLLIASYQIGLQGFIMIFAVLSYPMYKLFRSGKFPLIQLFLIGLPIYATILFSQPIAFTPALYLVLISIFDLRGT